MRNHLEIVLPILLATAICTILLGRHWSGTSAKPNMQEPQAKAAEAAVRPPRGQMVRLPPKTHLYPMPTTLVGAMVNGKPNFLAIAYVGACCYEPPMIAIGINKRHHTTAGILENNTFTVNIPSQDMLEATDYVGMVSGREVDKSGLFEVFYGDLKTAPMIRQAALAMECKVLKVVDLEGSNYTIIAQVVNTWVDENVLSRGVPDMAKMDPIIFAMYQNQYFKLGPQSGRAWHDGAAYATKHNLPQPKPSGH